MTLMGNDSVVYTNRETMQFSFIAMQLRFFCCFPITALEYEKVIGKAADQIEEFLIKIDSENPLQ